MFLILFGIYVSPFIKINLLIYNVIFCNINKNNNNNKTFN